MTDRHAGPSAAGFSLLLARLDADPERAGVEFERLRRALVRMFGWRRVAWPEERADEALDRLARKIEHGDPVENVAAMAHGIARLVALEAARLDVRDTPLDPRIAIASPGDPIDREELARVLDDCLDHLPDAGRRVVLAYYAQPAGREKIRNRRRLAFDLHLTDQALRSRVQRLRDRLEDCVRRRLDPGTAEPRHAETPGRLVSGRNDTP